MRAHTHRETHTCHWLPSTTVVQKVSVLPRTDTGRIFLLSSLPPSLPPSPAKEQEKLVSQAGEKEDIHTLTHRRHTHAF